MKKLIAMLLALVMSFSVVTVAFAAEDTAETTTAVAAEETTAAPEGEEEAAGDFDFLLDLPFWTVGPMFKFAKIALKLVKVVIKVGAVFGMEPGDILEKIAELVENAQTSQEETTAPATTVPEATAA